MINHWLDNALVKRLLARLRSTGGYTTRKVMPWGWYRVLLDNNKVLIFQTDNPSRSWIIATTIHHYEKGTDP